MTFGKNNPLKLVTALQSTCRGVIHLLWRLLTLKAKRSRIVFQKFISLLASNAFWHPNASTLTAAKYKMIFRGLFVIRNDLQLQMIYWEAPIIITSVLMTFIGVRGWCLLLMGKEVIVKVCLEIYDWHAHLFIMWLRLKVTFSQWQFICFPLNNKTDKQNMDIG